jgi:hypothetical protein
VQGHAPGTRVRRMIWLLVFGGALAIFAVIALIRLK